MNNAHEHVGLTISEVERLTGLPRRDIQRCCYNGKGGLGIVQPQNSTWGRRTYSAREVATLFVVRLEKQQGLSLPEIGEKLRKHPATGSEAEPGLLAVHIERLKERQEEVAGQLLAARALLMASQGEEPSLAGELIENEIDAQVVEALHKMVDEEARRDGMSAGCAAHRGWLARSFAPLVENADSSEASVCAALALAGAIDDIHGGYNVSHVAAKAILNWAFNAPGMSVVVDVWLGPGAYELLLRTLR